MTDYNQQYCEKHKQQYADFLKQCPICAGEELAIEYAEEVKKMSEELNSIGKVK